MGTRRPETGRTPGECGQVELGELDRLSTSALPLHAPIDAAGDSAGDNCLLSQDAPIDDEEVDESLHCFDDSLPLFQRRGGQPSAQCSHESAAPVGIVSVAAAALDSAAFIAAAAPCTANIVAGTSPTTLRNRCASTSGALATLESHICYLPSTSCRSTRNRGVGSDRDSACLDADAISLSIEPAVLA